MGLYTDLISDKQSAPAPQQQAQPAPPQKSQSQATVKQQSTHARKQARKLVSKHKKVLARKQTSTQASVHVTMRAYLDKILSERATHGFTFRYPPELLDQLEDLLYAVKKKHKTKLPKNAVAVMSLAYILKDYLENGDESVFHRVFIADREMV